MNEGLVARRALRQECGQRDQLSETFADWVAVQITAEALKSFAAEFTGSHLSNAATNAVRDLCEQEDGPEEFDLEFHPEPRIRIERIFGESPKVREVLGCEPMPSASPYCSFASPI